MNCKGRKNHIFIQIIPAPTQTTFFKTCLSELGLLLLDIVALPNLF